MSRTKATEPVFCEHGASGIVENRDPHDNDIVWPSSLMALQGISFMPLPAAQASGAIIIGFNGKPITGSIHTPAKLVNPPFMPLTFGLSVNGSSYRPAGPGDQICRWDHVLGVTEARLDRSDPVACADANGQLSLVEPGNPDISWPLGVPHFRDPGFKTLTPITLDHCYQPMTAYPNSQLYYVDHYRRLGVDDKYLPSLHGGLVACLTDTGVLVNTSQNNPLIQYPSAAPPPQPYVPLFTTGSGIHTVPANVKPASTDGSTWTPIGSAVMCECGKDKQC